MTAYTEKCSRTIDANPVRVTASLKQLIADWFANQKLRARLARERRSLAEMPDYLLKDIGTTRADAEFEASRRDVPAARLRLLYRADR